jgi:hypothetical protein
MDVQIGEVVRVKEYGGRVIERRVIADRGNRIVVCCNDEYHRAGLEGRQPDGIAFSKIAVVGVE